MSVLKRLFGEILFYHLMDSSEQYINIKFIEILCGMYLSKMQLKKLVI